MLRIILGVVLGAALAIGLITGWEMVGQQLFTTPPGTDLSNPEHLKTLVTRMRPSAKLFIVAGWTLAALAGGGVANLLARRRWPAFVPAALVAAGTLANSAMIPHPLWMTLGGVLLPALAAVVLYRTVGGATGKAAVTG